MYDDHSYKCYNFTIEELKRDTIYICRKKNITFVEYETIFDLIYFPDTDRKDFHHFFSPSEEDISIFFRNFFSPLKDFDLEIQDTSYLQEEEKSFYEFLPNDGDVLLSVIYYFSLDTQKQQRALRTLVKKLIYEQLNILAVKKFSDDKNLLETFHRLSAGRRKEVINFTNFLYEEQGKLEMDKFLRQERQLKNKLKRFKKD